jgi:hypothetical protein
LPATLSPAFLQETRLPVLFTELELEFLKRRFDIQFGEAPAVTDGILLKTWKSGPEKGRPKIPSAVKSLLDRNLVIVVSAEGRMPVAKFTEAGLSALSYVLEKDHVFSSARFLHLRGQIKAG